MNQQLIMLTCPDGSKHQVIEDIDAGEMLCGKCGIVLEERTVMDESLLPRAVMDESQTKFVGQNNKYIGESTHINKTFKDEKGKSSNKNLFRAINKWDSRIAWNNNKGKLISHVDQVCSKFKLTEVIHGEIRQIMKKLQRESWTRGRVTHELLGATIYYVSKKYNFPITMAEIGVVTNLSAKVIYRNLLVVNEACGEINAENKVTSFDSYVSKYFSKTNLPPKYEKDVLKLLKITQETKFHEGKSPSVLIGAIMKYIVITNKLQKQIPFTTLSKACDVSDVAVRAMCYKVTKLFESGA